MARPLLSSASTLAFLLGAAVHAQTWTPTGGSPQAPPAGPVGWEAVGDRPTKSRALAFDSTGAIYAGGSELYRLLPGAAAWELVRSLLLVDHLLPLRPDTLILGDGGVTRRSTDGGATWAVVFEDGGFALYEAPSRTLLSGMPFDEPGIGRSTDRGGTWALSPFVGIPPGNYTANAFLALPSGRLVAAGAAGLAYSDDDGATWRISNVWQDFVYLGRSLALAPDSGALAIVTGGASGWGLYASADGASWERLGAFHDPTDGLAGYTHFVTGPHGRPMADGTVLLLTGRGFLWRSVDSGATWALHEGRVPLVPANETHVRGRALGPDGRVYTSVMRAGPSDEGAWVYRTAGIVVPPEPGPADDQASALRLETRPNPSSGAVAVAVILPTASTVRAIVYDSRGREMTRLIDGYRDAGRHESMLPPGTLHAGTYVIRVETPDRTASHRFTVLR